MSQWCGLWPSEKGLVPVVARVMSLVCVWWLSGWGQMEERTAIERRRGQKVVDLRHKKFTHCATIPSSPPQHFLSQAQTRSPSLRETYF